MENPIVHTVAVCDTEPIAVEGLRSLLSATPDLQLVAGESSLAAGMELIRAHGPAVAVIDKAFGIHAAMDWVRTLSGNGRATAAVVWGLGLSEAEALRLVQSGAVGVIRKSPRSKPL